MSSRLRLGAVFTLIGLSLLFYFASRSYAQTSDTSQLVTWTCTGTPCPWGSPLSGQALVWPGSLGAVSNRLGYTVSDGIYLPESAASGLTVAITSGSAAVYAGLPGAPSHRQVIALGAGQSYTVTGLAAGEVISVQGGSFGFALTQPDPNLTPTPGATIPPTATSIPPTATSVPPTATTILPTATTILPTATTILPMGTPIATATGAVSLNTSQLVTWTCTGTPCPWGSPLSGQALVWPGSLGAVSNRLGYTVSAGIYLPESAASGLTVAITSGSAAVYAGLPGAPSHRQMIALGAGQSYTVTGLAAGEVISVQGGSFGFALTLPDPNLTPTPGATMPPTATTIPPTATTILPTGTPIATATEAVSLNTSQLVTWTCTGTPCPWGSPLSGQALVWPGSLGAVSNRLGYTVSAGIYLPESAASGLTVAITSGSAAVYAGLPDAQSHRQLAALSTGQAYMIWGLAAGEVVTVQGSQGAFTYALTTGGPTATATPVTPTPTATVEACVDPQTCNPVSAIQSYWRCNTPGCTDSDWVGAVVSWPAWSAFENNSRVGNRSRTVYSFDGEILYPYMGSWANGCTVTAVSNTVLIIEWQRGTDSWREIFLEPGDSHTISLVHPEDGAMIEGPDYSPGFSVTLNNCTPQVIDKTISPIPPTVTPTPTGVPATSTPATTSTPAATSTPAPEVWFPTTGVVDDFDRANGELGLGWSGNKSGYAISANQLDVGLSEDIYWNAAAFGVNQEAYATLSAVDANAAEISLVLKSQSSSSYGQGLLSVVYIPAAQLVQVWTFHPIQGWVQHGSNIPVTFADGDAFGARAWENGLVQIFRNGTVQGAVEVTAWPAYNAGGYIGVFMLNAGAAMLDDFGGGTIVMPQP